MMDGGMAAARPLVFDSNSENGHNTDFFVSLNVGLGKYMGNNLITFFGALRGEKNGPKKGQSS